ncbi:hypothetical protein GCM10020358_09480 [Amorphoplanes nipponensis]|uniref:SHOCT domain-containing protein n=1 Tax=Actinoplanes nipponensis TaxID=135950 RepID=A0A919JNQ8_9ACTN|nr:SHOCT domain-containing protein [Actinoplanes nipponensis]GIE54133.1 hypothetical protein Ani05nite_76670 [Actinoplanes nipponensis]
MMSSGNGLGAGWILIVLAVALTGLVLTAVVIAARDRGGAAEPPAGTERTLADRFARGEIDAEEYEQRLRTLRSGRR